jgi:hypothetical protein
MKDYGLLYKKNRKFVIVGYLDADFVGSVDERESTSGHLMNMGSPTIFQSCKKQTTVANSSA